MSSPPPFENKNNCTKCGASFGLIKRKHHCRNCARTFCGDCSTKTLPLPHFNINEPVRVCDQCANTLGQQNAMNQHQQQQQQQSAIVNNNNSSSNANTTSSNVGGSSFTIPVSSSSPTPSSTVISTPAPARTGFQSFSGFGRSSTYSYDMNGNLEDQLRQAIKNGDSAGVKQLLDAGADANYVDHTKNSVLHLAAMFDKFDIAKLLLDKGAKVDAKNLQNESPIDIAPPAMAHKIQAYTQQKQAAQ